MQHLWFSSQVLQTKDLHQQLSSLDATLTQNTGGGSNRPEDVELFLDVGEIFVARGEGGFALEGEGGGETVGVREFVLGAEFGGGMRQVGIGVHNLQRELGDILNDIPGDAGALGAPCG